MSSQNDEATLHNLKAAHPEWDQDDLYLSYAGDGQGEVDATVKRYSWVRYPELTSQPVEIYNILPVKHGQKVIVGYEKNSPNLLRVLAVL